MWIKILSYDQQMPQKNNPSEQNIWKVGHVHITDVGIGGETIH